MNVRMSEVSGGATLFGTPLSDLVVPAVMIALLGAVTIAVAVSRRTSWRVVEIVVAGVLGVAGGLVFAVWNIGYTSMSAWLVPPASALVAGMWLFPGVLGGLVIRKPGAAVYTELVAATVSALIGNEWGFATVYYGLIEGLGAEVVLALLLYRSWGLTAALLAGAGAGVAVGVLDVFLYWSEALDTAGKLAYLGLATVSGVVIAGLGGWALTRALARTGVLAPLASGRSAELV